jgi:hypothetical protein
MQGTTDRTFELSWAAEPPRRARGRTLAGGALALALLAGSAGVAALAADEGSAPRRVSGTQGKVQTGTYEVRVLGEGWDARGRYVLGDRGRLSDGPPAEPGVDGTRPVVFDTGTVPERLRLDLAEGHALRFARSGGEPSYGPGSWADLVTEISGRDAERLATVQVDAEGRLTALEEPYRP